MKILRRLWRSFGVTWLRWREASNRRAAGMVSRETVRRAVKAERSAARRLGTREPVAHEQTGRRELWREVDL